jgi:hypothetical protein
LGKGRHRGTRIVLALGFIKLTVFGEAEGTADASVDEDGDFVNGEGGGRFASVAAEAAAAVERDMDGGEGMAVDKAEGAAAASIPPLRSSCTSVLALLW